MKSIDNYIVIPFRPGNIDRYIVRKAILEALRGNLNHLSGKLLDSGCGRMPYRDFILRNSNVTEYVGLDIDVALNYDENVKPDITWDGITMPFQNTCFDCCIATEVLEHCPDPEQFLSEVYRVLKPKGILFFTVPFLWNLHEVPHDEYRYTPFALERLLRNSGFTDVTINATGGWHAAMAQMLGLWVKRSGLNRYVRFVLSAIFLPFMRMLLWMDRRSRIYFIEGTMITGLYGTARK